MEAGASSIPRGAALRAGLYAFLAAFLTLLLLVMGIALLFGGGTCAPGGTAEWTAAAEREIPPLYRRVYAAAATEFELPPAFLAAIGDIESDHGRNPAAQQVNGSGCVGPMQLGVGGACGDFVGAYGKDGNDDGRIDPRNPWDAVFTAANGLREGKGAPPVGEGSRDDYYRAACGYYGACAGYAGTVIATADRYGGDRRRQGGRLHGDRPLEVHLERERLGPLGRSRGRPRHRLPQRPQPRSPLRGLPDPRRHLAGAGRGDGPRWRPVDAGPQGAPDPVHLALARPLRPPACGGAADRYDRRRPMTASRRVPVKRARPRDARPSRLPSVGRWSF